MVRILADPHDPAHRRRPRLLGRDRHRRIVNLTNPSVIVVNGVLVGVRQTFPELVTAALAEASSAAPGPRRRSGYSVWATIRPQAGKVSMGDRGSSLPAVKGGPSLAESAGLRYSVTR